MNSVSVCHADELVGMLSSQTEKVFFSCSPCRGQPTEGSSLKVELQGRLVDGLEEVLTDLLSHNTTQHLLKCKMVRAYPLDIVFFLQSSFLIFL